ncbi:MAG: hypothetical protein JXR83_03405 [Deltaproteobacteria bacterium]|nr:hypothetical protein [Deltaproteobacteria bacterium]
MPHAFVHLFAIDRIRGDARLHPLAREALGRLPAFGRLGAILPDLPYFSSIWWRALWHRVGLLPPGARWADRLHHQRPLTAGLALLVPRAASRLGPLARLAIGAGYFSHAALDSALHPLVYRLIAEGGAQGKRAQRAQHMLIEKVQARWLIEHWLGYDLIDAPPLIEIGRLDPSVCTDRVLLQIEASLRQVFGRGPRPAQVLDWINGLAWYSARVRGRITEAEGPAADPVALRERYFTAVDLCAQYERAADRAVEWIHRISTTFEPGDMLPDAFKSLQAQFPEINIDQANDPLLEQEQAANRS